MRTQPPPPAVQRPPRKQGERAHHGADPVRNQRHAARVRRWCARYCRMDASRATFVAFIGFGLSSWIMTNAAYVELGVFIRELPERYSLVAYSIFALQSANVYPFLYMLLNARGQRISVRVVIWWLLALGTFVAALMGVLWRQTTRLSGHEHSLAMLVLTHLGGLVSATSTIVFYPFVATFPAQYTSALSTGEGLSGSLAALLGLLQRPYDDKDMRFSVEVFYGCCVGIMGISLLSFGFLDRHPWALRIRLRHDQSEHGGDDPLPSSDKQSPSVPPEPVLQSATVMARCIAPYLACQLVLAAFGFGVLPSVMPYVYKKFAPAEDAEAATTRFQTIASIMALTLDPAARLLTSWVRVYRVRELTLVLLANATALLVAALQDQPLASTTTLGYLLPLAAHVGFLVLYAYTQTMVYLTLKRIHETTPDFNAYTMYQWSGFATQIGAFLGTVTIFPLVFFREDLFLRDN